jgi:hypothetical protein
MQEVILRFQGLKFIVPKETECFWPYYGMLCRRIRPNSFAYQEF